MKKTVLITDVDNTLFDWVEFWGTAFSAMVSRISELDEVDATALYPEIKAIHQKHGTSEYAYLLEELPYVCTKPPAQRAEFIRAVNAAFAAGRDAKLHLYPTVLETLSLLKSHGCTIVAYTESFALYTGYRFRRFGLDGIVDYLYAPEPHYASESEFSHLSHSSPKSAELEKTQLRFTPAGEVKPNPHILQTICSELRIPIQSAIYVGDSPMKDIAMAQELGMLDALAAYGKAQHREEYELLKKVTHWPEQTVTREAVESETVRPSIVLNQTFSEIVDYIL